MAEALNIVADLLQKDWEIEKPNLVSEEEILRRLEQRVAYLIERNPEYFIQLMYRLDINEHKLNEVLQHHDAPAQVAWLVYKRQLQKAESRLKHKQDGSVDKDLEW